jgi:hypothetical protein
VAGALQRLTISNQVISNMLDPILLAIFKTRKGTGTKLKKQKDLSNLKMTLSSERAHQN